jgi:wyosine [tRNA(Phe)-imidazoG37] synthetase (radical SAM superfamily)
VLFRSYKGILWLEVFIVPGVNDSEHELALLKETALAIHPARVQLNTLDRPGACDDVAPASGKRLSEIAVFFAPLPVEIISRQFTVHPGTPAAMELEPMVLATLRRRPSTIEDIAVTSRHTINEITALLALLEKDRVVSWEKVNNHVFYKLFQKKVQ